MGLCIYANGWASGKGTHVSVAVHMMKGEFDSHLKWAFRGEMTVVRNAHAQVGARYAAGAI